MPEDTLDCEPVLVRPTGALFAKDHDGYLVPRASVDRIPESVWPAVRAVVEVYETRFGSELISIYIRGSAVCGGFVEGLSDLDTWAIVDTGATDVPRVQSDGYESAEARLAAAFPEIDGIELGHSERVRLNAEDAWFARMLLGTQSACIWGEDVAKSYGRFRPGSDIVGHALHVASSVRSLLEEPPDDVADACRWICKALVRAGLEVTSYEHGQYTRDLWPCWALFAAFHPDRAEVMKSALVGAVSPTSSADVLRSMLLRFEAELIPVVHLESR